MEYFNYVNNFEKKIKIKSKLLWGKNDKNVDITIAIPTYKRINFLRESLKSALEQNKNINYNIIIVDNDDNENNMEIYEMINSINDSRISYYKNEENIGMFGNWNRCIELSKGKYITILNDDDWLESNFLEEVIPYLDKYKGIYTRVKINNYKKKNCIRNYLIKFYNILTNLKKTKEYNLKDFFFKNRSYGTLGTIFNRELLIKLGGYNSEFFPSSDYILHANYCKNYGIIYLKKTLSNYRIAENESMKPETAFLWPNRDDHFRKYLLKYIEVDKNILKFLKKYQEEKIEKLWNLKIVSKDKNKYYFFKIYMFVREFIKDIK